MEFDPTLKSPGSLEVSGLCRRESEGPWELPGLPIEEHWLTACSNGGLPLQVVVRPCSLPPDPPGVVRCILLPVIRSWLRREQFLVPESCDQSRSGHTAEVETVGPVDP